jgi:hypothetical protein
VAFHCPRFEGSEKGRRKEGRKKTKKKKTTMRRRRRRGKSNCRKRKRDHAQLQKPKW